MRDVDGTPVFDAEAMVATAFDCIAAAVADGAVDPAAVRAVAFDGMISGSVGLGARGDVVVPYATIADTRYRDLVGSLGDRSRELLLARAGTSEPCMGPRSLWLRRTRPAQSRDVRAWTTISSFVAGRACARSAVPYIDRTQLWATGLADSESGEWSDDLCGAFAVPRSQLPDIVDPTDVVGQLSRQAARATGLPPGLPVVAGLGDQTAALLALGRPDDTEMLDVVGTYPNLIVTVPEYRADLAAAGIHMIPSMYPHAWHPATFVIEGGRTLAWAVETLTGAAGGDRASAWSALERDAASVAPGCDGLTFIPHFATGGGSWRGLSWMHTSAHLYRAVLEGLTFELAIGWSRIQAATPAMHVAALVTYGGGARSELWSQIKSDVIGVPQAIPTEPDLPAVGAALTAAAGVGALDLSDVPAARRTAGAYPSAAATGAYDGLIDVYRTQQEAPGVVRMVVRP